MKKIFSILTLIVLTSCVKDFYDVNTNPQDQTSVNPEELFPKAIITTFNPSYEYYYDYYRKIMPWAQMTVPSTGNAGTFMDDAANMTARYDVFYGDCGVLLTDMIHIVESKSAGEQAKYVYIKNFAHILRVYQAWYTTDVFGSIPYTEAFKARYGGTLTPKYDTQDALYKTLDQELKTAVSEIEAANSSIQVAAGNKDLIYGGDSDKWVRAANSLRLKMALRLSKRDPARMTSIVQEVINKKMISDNSQNFMLVGKGLASHGNFNPGLLFAPKSTVDFMLTNSDPRISLFYRKNSYSQSNIDKLIAAKLLKSGTLESGVRYVGGPSSPDKVAKSREFLGRRVFDKVTYDTISPFQPRLWQPEYSENDAVGTGLVTFPAITYADVCLMKAELAAKGVISDNPQTWYENGIRASIDMYTTMAKTAGVYSYTTPSSTDVENYVLAVKYNPSKGLEQIAIQQYLNYFKQPNEAWATIKRTGYPNTSSALKLDDITNAGANLTMPRRVSIPTPSKDNINYANQIEAINAMKQIPGFGNSESEITGRIWWDAF